MVYQEKIGLSFDYGDLKHPVKGVDNMLNIASCFSH